MVIVDCRLFAHKDMDNSTRCLITSRLLPVLHATDEDT